MEKFAPDVIKQFELRAEVSIKRITEINASASSKINIIHGNTAKKLPFQNNEFTTIICSPPYGDERNGVPYFQFAKNMLFWLKLTKEKIQSHKEQSLGWVGKRKKIDCPDSPTLKLLVDKIKHNKKTE